MSVYWSSVAERVIWTFVQSFTAVLVAAGPADLVSVSTAEAAGVAGLAAVASLIKNIAAKQIGDPEVPSIP